MENKERKEVEERPEGEEDGGEAVGGMCCKTGMEETSKGVDNGGGNSMKKRPQEKSDGQDDFSDAGGDKKRKK